MYPVLIRISHYSISTYGVFMGAAFLAAAWLARRGFADWGLEGDAAWDLLFFALFGGLVGAKLYYVVLKGDTSALLSRGGLVWYGGLIGGSAAVLFAIWRKRLPLGPTADALAPAIALGHGIGHVGCFFSGDSYGLPSTLPWAVAFPHGAPPSTAGFLRSEFGVSIPTSVPDATLLRVHPTMLYSAFALFLITLLLWRLARRPLRPGTVFGLYLILTGVERFLVEFVRAKDDRFVVGLTTAQVIAVVAILAGTAVLVVLHRRWSSNRPDGSRQGVVGQVERHVSLKRS